MGCSAGDATPVIGSHGGEIEMHCRIIPTTPDCFGFSSHVLGEFQLTDDARLASSSEVMEPHLSSAPFTQSNTERKEGENDLLWNLDSIFFEQHNKNISSYNSTFIPILLFTTTKKKWHHRLIWKVPRQILL